MTVRSSRDRRRSAEITPASTPPISHMIAAPMASETVTGNRSFISGQTAWSVRNE